MVLLFLCLAAVFARQSSPRQCTCETSADGNGNRMKCTEGKWINRNCDTFIKKVKDGQCGENPDLSDFPTPKRKARAKEQFKKWCTCCAPDLMTPSIQESTETPQTETETPTNESTRPEVEPNVTLPGETSTSSLKPLSTTNVVDSQVDGGILTFFGEEELDEPEVPEEPEENGFLPIVIACAGVLLCSVLMVILYCRRCKNKKDPHTPLPLVLVTTDKPVELSTMEKSTPRKMSDGEKMDRKKNISTHSASSKDSDAWLEKEVRRTSRWEDSCRSPTSPSMFASITRSKQKDRKDAYFSRREKKYAN